LRFSILYKNLVYWGALHNIRCKIGYILWWVDMFGENVCPVCGSSKFIFDRGSGEVVCSCCGCVVSTVVDYGPEWRRDDEFERSRVGLPSTYLLYDRGLATVIVPPRDRRSKVRVKSPKLSSIEQSMQKVLDSLFMLGQKLNIPYTVLEHAAYIYRKAFRKGLTRCRKSKAVSAAALHIALRQYGIPITVREISEASGVSTKLINNYTWMLIKELGVKMPRVDPVKYVRSIALKLGFNGEIVLEAEEIIRKAKDVGYTVGRNPLSLASAAIYIATSKRGYKVTYLDIADAVGVTRVSVREACKGLRRCM